MSAIRKVLVVDDDPVVGKSFDRVLSDKGYAVITATSGEDALRKLAHEEYDVVFTDIRMPGMDGIEVAEQVKAKQPWVPVVIVTGYSSPDNELRAEAAGVSGFLRKPLSPDLIEETARVALRERDASSGEPVAAPAAQEEAMPAPGGWKLAAKNIALFIAAPFVGLFYMLVFPIVGMGMLAYTAAKALEKYPRACAIGRVLKHTGMAIAAPFVALAYILILPFAGIAMLAWFGGKALLKR